MERNVLVDDFLHPLADPFDIIVRRHRAIGLMEVAEVTVGDGVLHIDLRAWEHIASRLAEQETERTEIDTGPRWIATVHIFDVTVVVDLEAQPLRHVVHTSRDNLVRSVEFKFGKHLLKGGSFGKVLGSFGVAAIDL